MWYGEKAKPALLPLAPLTPLMVNKATAAALCGMATTSYDKYAKKKLLPPMNATGRVSVAALQQAARRLDGVEERAPQNAADEALAQWEREK